LQIQGKNIGLIIEEGALFNSQKAYTTLKKQAKILEGERWVGVGGEERGLP